MPKQTGASGRPGRLTSVRKADTPEPEEQHVPQDSDSETKVPSDEGNDGGVGDWSQPEYAAGATSTSDADFDALDDIDEIVRTLYYGPEGTAKTTCIADMVNMAPDGNVLVVNAEGGLRKTALQARGIDTSRVRVWPKKGEPLTFEGLERLYYRVAADLEEDPLSWIGWAWDSDTSIYQAMLDNVIDGVRRKAEEVLRRAGKNKSGRAGNITMPDRFESDQSDYYNKMSQQFRLLLRKWRSLDCHFAMTALLRRDEDRKSHKVQYGPAVSPAISTDVLAYVDVVVRTATADSPAGPIWWGRTHGTADERGKDRLGVLPHRMIEPTMSRIQDYLLGNLTEDQDPLQVRFADLVGEIEEEERKAAAPSGPKTVKPPRGAAKKPAPKAEEPAEETADEPTTEAEANAPDEAPKRTATRPRARTASRPATADSAKGDAGGTGADAVGAASTTTRRRTATRKTDPKQTAAKAAVKEETEKPKSGPATQRVKARVRKAQGQPGVKFDSGKPPF